MSRRASFVKDHLDDLVQDRDIYKYFTDETGNPLARDNPLYAERHDMLEHALEDAYDTRLQHYGKKSFLQKYVATPLRALAGGSYAAGAGLFLTLAGPVGYGLTRLGVLSSSLADLIDSYAYLSQGQMKGRHLLEIWGENMITKPLSYLPLGTGLLDLYFRGRRKFDAKMKKDLLPHVKGAVDYAKELFLRQLDSREEEGRRIIPLRALRDERYLSQTGKLAA